MGLTQVNGSWWGLPWLLALCALVLAMTWMIYPARGHSWYEHYCCADKDCRPVDDGHVVERADGVHVKGWGILSHGDARLRWSRDDKDHVCEHPLQLVCVYRRPPST